MLTQRDLDIARVEAEARIQKMYDEWAVAFLGKRKEWYGYAKSQETLGVGQGQGPGVPGANIY